MAVNQAPGLKEVITMTESDHNNMTPQRQGAYDSRSKKTLGIILGTPP
jgi:hypothetical protein